MNVNQTLLNSQIEVIGEIIKDFKALKLKKKLLSMIMNKERSLVTVYLWSEPKPR